MNRLKAFFVTIGLVAVGGVSYVVANLRPDVTVAQAVDAGLLQVSTTLRLSCRLRVSPTCQATLGLPAYGKFGLRAQLVTGTDPDVVLFNLPNDANGLPCFRPVGTVEEACDAPLETGACSIPAICNANALPQLETQACACFRPDAGNCRVPTLPDAGGLVQAVTGVTIQAPWIGSGCFRKFCGPVVAGEQTADWPPECPQ